MGAYIWQIETIFDLLALIQGFIFGIIFISEKNKNYPRFFLGLFLVCYVLELIPSIAIDSGLIKDFPFLEFLPFNFYFLTQPLLFIYAKAVTSKLNWTKDIIHVIPGIIEFLVSSVILVIVITGVNVSALQESFVLLILYIGISGIYIFYYAVRALNYIRKYRKQLKHLYSNFKGKQLQWLYHLTVINLLLGVTSVAILIPTLSGILSFKIAYVISSSLNIVFIYWLTIGGIKQVKLESYTDFEKVGNLKIAKKSIVNENNEARKLQKFMEDEKPYKDPDLNLSKLSQQCNISQRNLSRVINQIYNTNFNRFINKYRVEEAMLLLKNDDYSKFGVEGIGIESGFNSKTTFYSVFKKFCGVSPNQYRNE